MPTGLEWNPTVDPSEVVRQTRDTLAAGAVVVLPGDAGYVALATPVAAGKLGDPSPLAVLAYGPQDPVAFGVDVPEPVARLMARAWPAPLAFEFPAAGLTPPDGWQPAWGRLTATGFVRFRSPDHPLFDAVLSALDFPAIVAETFLPTAAAVAERLGEAVGLTVSAGTIEIGEKPTVLRCENGTTTIAEPGAFSADEIEKLAARIVLFVCTGNTCRSPLAEGLAKRMLADKLGCGVGELPSRGFWLLSAGTSAWGGGAATPEAADVAAEFGADLGSHQSRPVNPQLLIAADDVIVMTQGHAAALVHQFGDYAPPVKLLCGDDGDLEDPIGSGLEVYRACAATIRRHLERIIPEWVGT
ncbi:MAG TPA: Sua5/YciO/YrdC/YwlC family protein [Gemmataceae bacterium]|nr:Sua5/YciO/YrdC/YwlC family protein [Gemmataceae bacterium]